MQGPKLTTTIIYRWRYQIGYALLGLLLVGVLVGAGFFIPGSLSSSELASIVATAKLSPTEIWLQAPLNMPYHLLQHLSLTIFGVTLIGIKLPSLLIGLATAVSLALLLRRWYPQSIAVLTSIIVVSTSQFIFLAQQGSPDVLHIFWPTTLLLMATLAAQESGLRYLWLVLGLITAGLSLYTPLSIYVLLALLSAVLLHPHLRFLLRKLNTSYLAIGAFLGAAVTVPLAAGILRDKSVGLMLLGIPNEWPNLLINIQTLLKQYFGFASFGTSSLLLPIFGLSSMLIIIYGILLSRRTVQTVQGHIIVSWTILLLPALLLNPVLTSIMFVPLTLLLATGLSGLLTRWYSLFPFNPYARVAGLMPLIVLIGCMVLFGLERYSYGYRYSPKIVENFSSDILILPDVKRVVVSEYELPLYQAVAHYSDSLFISTSPPPEGKYAVTASAYRPESRPDSVITTAHHDDAARFYLYGNR